MQTMRVPRWDVGFSELGWDDNFISFVSASSLGQHAVYLIYGGGKP